MSKVPAPPRFFPVSTASRCACIRMGRRVANPRLRLVLWKTVRSVAQASAFGGMTTEHDRCSALLPVGCAYHRVSCYSVPGALALPNASFAPCDSSATYTLLGVLEDASPCLARGGSTVPSCHPRMTEAWCCYSQWSAEVLAWVEANCVAQQRDVAPRFVAPGT